MQDFTAMALFVHVVERGGFTAAARHISLPLSTVSRRIAELEKDLGVRLLERSTRKLRLTELGESYYEFCRRGLQEFDSANLMIQNRQTEVSGLLRITTPPNLVAPYFIPLVNEFQRKYPNARVSVTSTERQIDLLHEGIDLAFRVGPLKDSRMTARRIAEYRHHLVASPEYIEAMADLESPKDLTNHSIIVFGTNGAPSTWTLTRNKGRGNQQSLSVTPAPHLLLNDYQAIISAVVSGGGISEIPAILCSEAVEKGLLVELIPQWQFAPVTISAVSLSTRNMSRLVRLFLDYCFETLPGRINAAAKPMG